MRYYSRRKIIAMSLGLIVVSSLATFAIIGFGSSDESETDVVAVLGETHRTIPFTIYSFDPASVPGGFSIDEDSINYDKGLLAFRVIDTNGNAVAITQQALPRSLVNSSLQGDESFSTQYGEATFSITSDGRLTGSLATQQGTLILLNSGDSVTEHSFKDIIRFLKAQ